MAFVLFSSFTKASLTQKTDFERQSKQTFYLNICVALSLHSQHTTYFENVTLTQLMLTLSCQRVYFKGFLKTHSQNRWFWVELSTIH